MRQSFAPPFLFLSLSDLIYPFPLSLRLSLLYFHASLASLTLFLCFTIFNLLRRSSFVSLDLLTFLSFLVLSTLFSFSAKFNLQFSLYALLYFMKFTKSFVLLLLDGQVQLVSRIFLRMLCVKSLPF